MNPTRRSLLELGLLTLGRAALPQGVSSRNVQPQTRAKPSGLPYRAQFVDIAAAAGLHYPSVYGEVDRKDYILETIGCGCAFLDYDNDGWPDLFVLSGTRVGNPPPNTSNRLYHNNRDGTFTDVTEKAGLLSLGWASGVCIGDYNNDGWEDIFITQWGENKLFRNNGNGTFTDVTREAGLLHKGQARWGTGCTFTDYNRDGHLDLVVTNYLVFDFEHAPVPGANTNCSFKGVPVNCGPRGLPYGRHSLYRNNGDGTFTDVSVSSGLDAIRETYGLTVVAADFNDDGWPDIYIACDSTPSVLLINQHDGTFKDEAVERGVALSEDGMEQAGMGVAVGDLFGSNRLDIFKTHFADDTNVLYRNLGKGNFDDVTSSSGLGVETRFIGWGAAAADFQNAGLQDVLFVTGNVYPEIAAKLAQYPLATPRVVFRNLGGGKFEELIDEAGPGIRAAHCSRGLALGDFDNDGDLDALIVNLNQPPSLLRNDVRGEGNWIKVKLIGTTSNRSAIGCRATLRFGPATAQKTLMQELLSGSSFLSNNESRLHFGLGPATSADVTLRWPTGQTTVHPNLAANSLHTIHEGAGAVRSRLPSASAR